MDMAISALRVGIYLGVLYIYTYATFYALEIFKNALISKTILYGIKIELLKG